MPDAKAAMRTAASAPSARSRAIPRATKPAANSTPDGSAAMLLRRWSIPPRCRATGSRPAPTPRSRPARVPACRARRLGPKLSRKRVRTIAIAIRPIGRLIQKIQRQPRCLRDQAADGGADDQRKTGDADEDAKRACALLPAERAAQDRHCQRHDKRGAGALRGAGRDQRDSRAGQRAGRRGQREQRRCRPQTSCGDRNGRRARRRSAAAPRKSDCRR